MATPFEQLPLRDIHLPDPVSWWPLASGWWLLAILLIVVLLALGLGIRWALEKQRAGRLRRAALRALDDIEARHRRHQDAGALMCEISVWLRRVAVSAYGYQAGGQTGRRWIDWLNEHSRHPAFDEALGLALTEYPYRPRVDADPLPVLAACRAWIRGLKSEP